jgi:hypothetical protein
MAKSISSEEKKQLELGKKLQIFYELGYVDKKQALLWSFSKGLAGGLGAFLGGTIIVALVLWFLSFFNQVPLIDHIVRSINHSIQTKQ